MWTHTQKSVHLIGVKMNNTNEKNYIVKGVNKLYALYWIDRSDPYYGNRFVHIKNLGKDYLQSVQKAENYIKINDPSESLAINPATELADYNTASTGKRQETLAWIEDLKFEKPHYEEFYNECVKYIEALNNALDKYHDIWLRSGKDYPEYDVRKRNVMREDESNIDNIIARINSANLYLARDILHKVFGKYVIEAKNESILTEKQLETVDQIFDRYYEKYPQLLEQFQTWRKERDEAKPVPVCEDRVEVEGTIKSVKWHDHEFGSSLKMIIKSKEGYLLWGTLPRSVERLLVDADDSTFQFPKFYLGDEGKDLVGSHISFMAKIERSDKDKKFGFYKIPTQVKLQGVYS